MRRSLSPDDRKLLMASLGVLVAAFALVSSNVAANHSPRPHGLPIGIVGTPAVVNAARAELAEDRRASPLGLRRVPARARAGPAGRQRRQSPRGPAAAANVLRGGRPI